MNSGVSEGRGTFQKGATTRRSSIAAALGSLKHKNLATEPLAKLLKDAIKQHRQRIVVPSRAFREMRQKNMTDGRIAIDAVR